MTFERLTILSNNDTDTFKNMRKDVATPFQEGLLPHSKKSLVRSHPPTLPTCQKNPCDIGDHKSITV